jgi:hypothetical protein
MPLAQALYRQLVYILTMPKRRAANEEAIDDWPDIEDLLPQAYVDKRDDIDDDYLIHLAALFLYRINPYIQTPLFLNKRGQNGNTILNECAIAAFGPEIDERDAAFFSTSAFSILIPSDIGFPICYLPAWRGGHAG